MRYWDASALVPLLFEEPASQAVRALYRGDSAVTTWWGTVLECTSALARRERDNLVGIPAATRRLAALAAQWQEVMPTDLLRATAGRLLRTHALRTSDALQLAAAIVVADGAPRALAFVTLDDRLAVAADKEGFPVIVPGAAA